MNNFNYLGSFELIYTQLRSNWYDFLPGCIVFNSRSAELNLIVTLITDIGLLLTMLFGLFRLRREGRGTIGIGSLLWKQVGSWPFTLFVVL
jgi:hypothetical protein